MMGIRFSLICWAVLLLTMSPLFGQEVFRPLRGPYLGQEAGEEPEIFLPGKISSGFDEGCSLFFPDALSFMWKTERGGVETIFLLEDRDGRWQQPERVEFLDGEARVWDIKLAPGGDWIYFVSDWEAEFEGANIWRVPLVDGKWGRAEILGSSVNSDWTDSHPSIALNGDLYFARFDPANGSEGDIFVARREGAGFAVAVPLEAPINNPGADYDPFIAPDGNFLIFASHRPGGFGKGDLYISYREQAGKRVVEQSGGEVQAMTEGWGVPINLGAGINSPAEENRPSITVDGRFFFFISDRINRPKLPPGVPPASSMPGSGSRDIYWMNASFLRR